MTRYDPTVTVCDKCLRAACWQGEFMCDDAYGAGTVERHVSTLVGPNATPHTPVDNTIEHPDWWNNDLKMRHERLLTTKDLELLGIKNVESLELS